MGIRPAVGLGVYRALTRFEEDGAEIYCAELTELHDIRLQRSGIENRLKHKASKRDLDVSSRLYTTGGCGLPVSKQ